jgi:hypothetical protein
MAHLCRKSSETCPIVIYYDISHMGKGQAYARRGGVAQKLWPALLRANRCTTSDLAGGMGPSTTLPPSPRLQSPPACPTASNPIIKYVTQAKKAWPHPSKDHPVPAKAPCTVYYKILTWPKDPQPLSPLCAPAIPPRTHFFAPCQ